MIIEKEKIPSIETGGMEHALEEAIETPNIGVRTKVENYFINFQIPFGQSIDVLLHDKDQIQSLFPQREAKRTDGVELSLQYIKRIQRLAEELDRVMEGYSVSVERNQPFFELIPLGIFRFKENGKVCISPIDIFILKQFFSKRLEALLEGVKKRGDTIYSLSLDKENPIYLYKEDVIEAQRGFDFFLLVADAKSIEDLNGEK